jgi:thiamine biosynthesis lipoprotein
MRAKFLVFVTIIYCSSLLSQNSYKKSFVSMGSSFEITVTAKNKEKGYYYIDLAINEITRIEKLISSWDKDSQTSKINNYAGIKPVIVDLELFDLINRSIKISELTKGAFDISYASMDKVWFFDKQMESFPNSEIIKKSIQKVGYDKIILDSRKSSIYLKDSGMKISFGAIGKGYAADKAKELLINEGIKSGIINASGDLNAWGKQKNGKDWMVAITNPLNTKKVYSWLPINNSSVATSGNYEKFIKFNDKVYSHIIDPRTGYPSEGILSVSVFCKTAELSDALATSIFVMGIETGLDLINQLKGVECIIIDNKNNIIKSNKIELYKI